MTTSTTQLDSNSLTAVVTWTVGRLHAARPGARCRCGACRHQIVVASRRSGIAIHRILASLPPESACEMPWLPHSTAAKRSNPFLVMDTVTVTTHERQQQGTNAVLALLGAA